MRGGLPGMLLLLAGCPFFGPGDREALFDRDGDGYEGLGGPDCDDDDPEVHPDAEERCDGIDNDCDGAVDLDDEGLVAGSALAVWVDGDGDGYGDLQAPTVVCALGPGVADVAGDCDDTAPAVHPGATERCGGGDEDCDGLVDSDDPDAVLDAWFADGDADGHGAGAAVAACEAPAEHVALGDDCDDTDPAVHPGADERCGGGDEDCDGFVDDADPEGVTGGQVYYVDADGDGHGADVGVEACALPAGHAATGDDCDDGDAAVHPGADEVFYDGVDQDCDGGSDYDADADGFDSDLYGGADCADADASVSPAASEVFYDGVDQDCDGGSDYDADADGFDSDLHGGDDCDDADASVSPAASEVFYDGVDQDCDGGSDYDADADGFDSELYGGDDCDDTEPSVFPGSVVEVPGDLPTVQEALDRACVGSTVRVAAGTWAESLVIRRSVRLEGATGDAEDVVIDGQAVDRVVDIRAGAADVTLADLTLARGSATDGGCLKAKGSVLLLDGIIAEGCVASGDGGALYADGVDELTLRSSLVHASRGDAGGGARFVATGHLRIEQTTFSDNVANGPNGGGLYLETSIDDRTCVLEGVDFLGNQADGTPAAYIDVSCEFYDLVVADNVGGGFFGTLNLNAPVAVDGLLAYGNLTEGGAALSLDLYVHTPRVLNLHALANDGDGVEVAFGEGEVAHVVAAGNTGHGIVLADRGVGGPILASYLTSVGNGGSGVRIEGDHPTELEALVSTEHGGAGLEVVSGAPVRVTHSLVDGNGADWSGLPDATGLDGNLAGPVAFTAFIRGGDPFLWDLTPAAGSVLIDAGPPGALDADGSAADIGAYGGPDAAVPVLP